MRNNRECENQNRGNKNYSDSDLQRQKNERGETINYKEI